MLTGKNPTEHGKTSGASANGATSQRYVFLLTYTPFVLVHIHPFALLKGLVFLFAVGKVGVKVQAKGVKEILRM